MEPNIFAPLLRKKQLAGLTYLLSTTSVELDIIDPVRQRSKVYEQFLLGLQDTFA